MQYNLTIQFYFIKNGYTKLHFFKSILLIYCEASLHYLIEFSVYLYIIIVVHAFYFLKPAILSLFVLILYTEIEQVQSFQ